MASIAEDRVREAGGDELCERLLHLDATRASRPPAPLESLRPPDRNTQVDYDVAIVGGGLSLLLAPLVACLGLRVAVFERARAGVAHREWNAGMAELTALSETGLFSAREVADFVVARYAGGLCRWHGGGTYPVTGVLDHAVDARALLGATLERAKALGVSIHDFHTLASHAEGDDGVRLAFRTRDGGPPRSVTARVWVDARGASSPFASADLVCPTVGGVLGGLEQGDDPGATRADTGEILVTTEGVVGGRQHIWEAFPGRPGETTVYLFYYARAGDAPPGSLMALYARFFDQLGDYKRGDARLLRPTFGYIPGWSRLTRAPRAPGKRTLLVGDAAARHSPLTFCGFGTVTRSLHTTAHAIADAASGRPADELPDAPIHAGTGALARMMATPSTDPARAGELNELLDTAFSVLFEMGNDAYGALLRDEMSARLFIDFLRKTARRRPRVYREALRALKPALLAHWGLNLARERARAR